MTPETKKTETPGPVGRMTHFHSTQKIISLPQNLNLTQKQDSDVQGRLNFHTGFQTQLPF